MYHVDGWMAVKDLNVCKSFDCGICSYLQFRELCIISLYIYMCTYSNVTKKQSLSEM